jgi:hypothetical protein
MEDFKKRLGHFVQVDEVDKYMEWLKDNPSIIMTSSNDHVDSGVTFICGKCHIKEGVAHEETNNYLNITEWECKICTGDDPKRLGRAHTMMIRLN